MNRLVLGCGYLGLRVARLWRSQGDSVYAVTRCQNNAQRMKQEGIIPVIADITEPDSVQGLPQADTILFAVGMDRKKYDSVHSVYVEGLKNVLSGISIVPSQLIYVSSTGVYGNFDGAWIDENSPTDPAREGGKACLAAEETLRKSRFAAQSCILRFAGIYGPQRVPTKALIQSEQWKKISSDGFLNLIHVDDGANIIQKVADQAIVQETFNVSDGNPPKRKEYYQFIAEQLGLSEIPWEETNSVNENTRSGSNKRISNKKLVGQLGNLFQYENFRLGLQQALTSVE
ncbi:SDR family oxidoreductase [bacterium]|nr:SDR family oxidoreductase [bacterium]